MSLDQPAGGDPGKLRISDVERHRTADFLRDAAGEGRIDVEELDERLEATYAAKTYADLLPILADLPGADGTPVVARAADRGVAERRGGGPPVPATRYDTSVAIMSGQDRRGVWQVGATHQAFALMGAVTVDLREAQFAAAEVEITANTFWGGVEVVVGPRQRVAVEGVGIMGDFSEARSKAEPDLGPDSPLVRVRGVAIMGAVSVVRKADPGRRTPRRRCR